MKKFICFILSAVLFISLSAAAEDIDLSGLSFDQLVDLRERLNLAIWNCQEWQEVTVPEGIWIVGQDIPAGHWSIRVASDRDYFYISYFDTLDENGLSVGHGYLYQADIASPGWSAFGDKTQDVRDIDMKEGWYFKNNGAVIFTPYSGKPDLGFK